MTTPITKLIEENKERPIAEAPRDGTVVFVTGCYSTKGWWKGKYKTQFAGTKREKTGWGEEYGTSFFPKPPTHFRSYLLDDRIVRVTELYDKFITQLANADMAKTILDWPKLAQNIREQATAIAEGKDNEIRDL